MRERHAVYATCTADDGERITFRVGAPTDWGRAQARWLRLDDWRRALLRRPRARSRRWHAQAAGLRVRWGRRWYLVDFLEVRAVDRHGRGLGAERHGRALPVPYRAAQRRAA